MKEFAFGTDSQFAALEAELLDNQCHVYMGCDLPACCTPNKARLGFEKTEKGHYIVYIDKGIQAESDNPDFNRLIVNGEIKFVCLEDMVSFLHGLQPLFSDEGERRKGDGQSEVKQQYNARERDIHKNSEPENPSYDPAKVKEIMREREKPRMVNPDEIAAPIKKNVFGQNEAIDAIANKIAVNQTKKEKKFLVMALLGPTGTGKSETAKMLAQVLSDIYETPYGFIEIAGSEFVGEHSVNRFFGAPPGFVGYGNDTVLEPVRKNKKHVIVINEIEKADAKLLTGLMEALDTGHLGMADNTAPIDLTECIMFFTSNLKIDMERYSSLPPFAKAEMCRDCFTKHCGRPEISARISNFIAFDELSDEANMQIADKFAREALGNYDIRLTAIDEGLMAYFLSYKTKYGARGIREVVSDAIGSYVLKEKKPESLKNKSVRLKGTIDNIEFEIA